MKHFGRFLLVFAISLRFLGSHARVVVVSSTCVSEIDGVTETLSCPAESGRFPESVPELDNDLATDDRDQRFCCGPPGKRYCCDLDQKQLEDPRFDPSHEPQDAIIEVIQPKGEWSLLHVFLFLTFGVFCTFILIYFFGSVIVALLDCIFMCCCRGGRSKTRSNYHYRPPQSNAPHSSPGENSGLAGGNTQVYSYNTLVTPSSTNTDLYQNVTSTPPPSYNSLENAVA